MRAVPLPNMRSKTPVWLICLLACLPATARSIDTSPLPVVLLRDGGFIAQHGRDGVSLYDPAGKPVHRFLLDHMTAFAVTADQTRLVLVSGPGMKMFDVRTGAATWTNSNQGVGFCYDVSFARDGRTFVASGYRDATGVFETATGRQISA